MQPDRYDLLIASSRRGMRVSPQGVRALVQHWAAMGAIQSVMQTETRDFTEVHALPGELAHALFHEGASTGVVPVYHEVGIRFGPGPLAPGYDVAIPVYFYVEFRGLAFDTVLEETLTRVDQILACRPVAHLRPHTGLRSRDGGAPDDPGAPQRRDLSSGRIGVRVEER